jgi:hypothetical protein
MGLLIAAILATTMLGMVYLTQTLGSNATSSEISGLASDTNGLRADLRNQSLSVGMKMDAEKVTKRARALKLQPLGDTVVLPTP